MRRQMKMTGSKKPVKKGLGGVIKKAVQSVGNSFKKVTDNASAPATGIATQPKVKGMLQKVVQQAADAARKAVPQPKTPLRPVPPPVKKVFDTFDRPVPPPVKKVSDTLDRPGPLPKEGTKYTALRGVGKAIRGAGSALSSLRKNVKRVTGLKKGGSVKADMKGRAMKKSTADARGRAMKGK